MKWPFSLTLKNIATSGKSNEEARLYHELKGEELERALLELSKKYDDVNKQQYLVKKLKLDKKYSKITEEEYEYSILELEKDNIADNLYIFRKLDLDKKYNKVSEEEYEYASLEHKKNKIPEKDYIISKLDLDKKYNKVSDLDYNKQLSSINKKPWVAYKDYGLEEHEGKTGLWFEMDWNTEFVELLKKEGYTGKTEEDIVKKWYAELCRTVALEEGLALDLFEEPTVDEKVERTGSGIIKTKIDEKTSKYE